MGPRVNRIITALVAVMVFVGAALSASAITASRNTKPTGVAYSDPDFDSISVGGVVLTSTPTELNLLHGVTAGTTTGGKALVVSSGKNLDALNVSTLVSTTSTLVTSTITTGNVTTGNITSGNITTLKYLDKRQALLASATEVNAVASDAIARVDMYATAYSGVADVQLIFYNTNGAQVTGPRVVKLWESDSAGGISTASAAISASEGTELDMVSQRVHLFTTTSTGELKFELSQGSPVAATGAKRFSIEIPDNKILTTLTATIN